MNWSLHFLTKTGNFFSCILVHNIPELCWPLLTLTSYVYLIFYSIPIRRLELGLIWSKCRPCLNALIPWLFYYSFLKVSRKSLSWTNLPIQFYQTNMKTKLVNITQDNNQSKQKVRSKLPNEFEVSFLINSRKVPTVFLRV